MVIPEEQPAQPALPIQPEGMRVVCGHCGNTFLVCTPTNCVAVLLLVRAYRSSPEPNHRFSVSGDGRMCRSIVGYQNWDPCTLLSVINLRPAVDSSCLQVASVQ